MTTIHDDRPHPIPPFAYLRYKENYFFILFSEVSDVYGVIHLNFEPGFNKARFTCNLTVRGKLYKYENATEFPAEFELSEQLSDGRLTLKFIAPHQQFDFTFNSDEIEMEASFTRRQPTFDYSACRTAAPEMSSFQEVLTYGLNLPYNHQQQGLNLSGSLTLKESGETLVLDGTGYRDHSWVMRADAAVARHSWCGINFPELTFGIKTIKTLHRADMLGREGYVADAQGARALRSIRTRTEGEGPDGQPGIFIHELVDVLGNEYEIRSDIANRVGDVTLISEAATTRPPYQVIENFVRSELVGTGQACVALVELGRNVVLKEAWPQAREPN